MKIELTVKCPKCKAKPGQKCLNMQTNVRRNQAHGIRIELAETTAKKAVAKKVTKTQEKFTGKPKATTCTAEQRAVGEMLQTKIMEILGPKHMVRFVPQVSVGPVISTYRFQPLKKTKVAHLENLAKDFAVLLGAEAVLVKRMPGESVVGVFIPNAMRKYINFRDTIGPLQEYMKVATRDGHTPIPLNLGQDQEGNPFIDDLTMQPHLLVAGTTGAGKSTLLHGMVAGLGYAMTSKELKLVISDTKGVEFPHFANLPHLQFPIANDVFTTMQQMKWATVEAQDRMAKIAYKGVRNIHEYNAVASEDEKLPFVVVLIDELADLMGDAVDRDIAKAAAGLLKTIVQRARTSGIYMIASTQRPDVKAVGGAIKANFPSRLTFRLPSSIDSRTVIHTKGAEHLMSQGDMLYTSAMHPELRRLHAPYTSIEDVKAAVQVIVHREAQVVPAAAPPAAEALEQPKTTIQ